MFIEKAIEKMKHIFKDAPYGIDHTEKVLQYAQEIIDGEKAEENREIVSVSAVLHDIGTLEAQRKHGTMAAPYQEIEGEIIAREILTDISYDIGKINRVCYIVGNHHTQSKIDGLDFQILWEADLIANMEHQDLCSDIDKLRQQIDISFKTYTGRNIAYSKFCTKK